MLHRLYAINYHPCSEASEGYVFTGICLSKSEGGGVGDTHGTRLECLPLPPTPPGPGQNVYPPWDQVRMSTPPPTLPRDQVRIVYPPPGPGQNVYPPGTRSECLPFPPRTRSEYLPSPPKTWSECLPPHLRLGQNVYPPPPETWTECLPPPHLRLGQNVYPPLGTTRRWVVHILLECILVKCLKSKARYVFVGSVR